MPRDDSVSSVNYDYFSSSLNRVQWAMDRGFKKFVYFRPGYNSIKETRREQGVQAALSACENLEAFQTYYYDAADNNLNANISAETPNGGRLSPETRRIVDSLSDDTFIICSAPEMQNSIMRYLFYTSLLKPDKESNWQNRGVSYVFPHNSIGTEAARSLLTQIHGEEEVRKLTVPPALVTYSPEAFY